MKLNLSADVLALNPELARTTARTQDAPRFGAYRSQLEQKAAELWCPTVFAPGWMYEPFTLRMPGLTYTPDFFGTLLDGRGLACVEAKGWNKNLRADKAKFRAAVEVHPWLSFCWLTWDRREGWVGQWYLSAGLQAALVAA